MTRKDELGLEILQNCRTELYYYFPHLDGAFSSISYRYDKEERSIRTDGKSFLYSGDFLVREYIRESKWVVRGYLHMLLHCLYLHPWTDSPEDLFLWNIACDIAVESVIEKEEIEDLKVSVSLLRKRILKSVQQQSLSATQIYQKLLEKEYPGTIEELQEAFSFDDHTSWQDADERENREMKAKWNRISLFSGDRKGKSATYGVHAGDDSEVLDDFMKSRYDYRRFLKQFSVIREEVELDLESFDYIYYHLGMEQYQDMPLIEPLEYKEVNRLEELVIAIDTSSSCTTQIVQQFLSETYQMLSQKENFFRKMNVYIIQCDTHIEDVVAIHSEEEWKRYSGQIQIYGRGGTDFRPVFRYVKELQDKKELRNLRALIYFTDGDGVFPKEKPPYETAFVFLKEKAKLDYVPSWAQVLLI